jgi:hypothetical protein
MNQCNPILLTKIDHWFSLERCNIISNNYAQTTKSHHNILKKTNDYRAVVIPCRDGFYPLGEVISGSQNPPMLTT